MDIKGVQSIEAVKLWISQEKIIENKFMKSLWKQCSVIHKFIGTNYPLFFLGYAHLYSLYELYASD